MKNENDGFYSSVELIMRCFGAGEKTIRRFTKEEMEARQAALFGYAYAVLKGLDLLVIKPGETCLRDGDAEFRWLERTTWISQKVSLKRLTPLKEPFDMEKTLTDLLQDTSMRSVGDDLLVAIHLDRYAHFANVSLPPKFRIRELCFWGLSKPDWSEIFVKSRVLDGAQAEREGRIPFPPPGFSLVSW